MATKFTYTAECGKVMITHSVQLPMPTRRVNENVIQDVERRITRYLRTRFPGFVRVFILNFEAVR